MLTIRGSPYQIFVRELVAMDGSDASEILLIDSIGDHCSDNIHNFKFRAKMSGLKFSTHRLSNRLQYHAGAKGGWKSKHIASEFFLCELFF